MKRAIFKIEAEGVDITNTIKDRFLGLTVTDSSGKNADNFRLILDNRDDKLKFPRTGAQLRIWMGLEGVGLMDKGLYTIDNIMEVLEDGHLEIGGRAADMAGTIKGQNTRTWPASTLGHIAQQIAAMSGLKCQVHPSCSDVQLPSQTQKAESDMNFIRRLCEAKGFISKFGGGFLLVVPKEAGESPTGQALEVVVIDDPTESTGRVTLEERGTAGSVTASYFDADAQQTVNVTAVGSDPTKPNMVLKGKHRNREEAQAAAEAKLREASRGKVSINLVTILRPEIVSPGKVIIKNHRQSANGTYWVESVEHSIISDTVSSSAMNLSNQEHEASKKK